MNFNIETVQRLLFYFIIYSVLGWIMESCYRSMCEKKIINSGFMNGPYCPIYGFGAIIMSILFSGMKNNITLLFCAGFVILTAWEYLVGVILEKVYHTKYWDYSEQKININGRVCITNSIYWGIISVIFIKIVHPLMVQFTNSLSNNILVYIDISVGIIMIIDFIISSVSVNMITKKLQEIKILGEKTLEKLNIGSIKKKKSAQEELNTELETLQLRYTKLKVSLYKQIKRMKNAFPTMQSESINKFINEKIDINELKNKIKEIQNNRKIKKDELKKGKK